MTKTFAALALAVPLAALGQYDPQSTPAEPPPSEWEATPAPAPSTWGAAPAPQPAPARRPAQHVRDAWYIGFGLGGGGGSARDTFNGTNDFSYYVGSDPMQLSLNFQVGATLSPRLLLGLDVGALGAVSSADGVDSQFQLSTYDVAVTYFPWETGLFVKGGVGLAALTWDIEGLGQDTWRGANVMGGLGYALWLGQNFNLSLNLDVAHAWFGGDEFESATTTNVYLGFMWY